MSPSYEQHFLPGSLVGLIRRGHPYDFADTYRALSDLYGYDAAYVNLGLWDAGPATVEAGRALAMLVAEPLGLADGETLVDAGSGLGQAAVDLSATYHLATVVGVNPNVRQVGFARALVVQAHLGLVVRFDVADASTHLATLPEASAHGVLAVECVGHFPDPQGFLRGVHHALQPGRRLSFCLNVATRPLSWWERILFQASFGFVPSTEDVWRGRLSEAGLVDVQALDLTARVTEPVVEVVTARLNSEAASRLSFGTRMVARVLLWATGRAVRRGHLRYLRIDAAKPEAP